MKKGGYVYIMSNTHRTVLYIGVTSNLEMRVYQHETSFYKGFTKKYNCHDLIYYEIFDGIEPAIAREKAMKKWNRLWKERQIKTLNPEMKRLNNEISSFN
jgi:putative endonuclease